MKKHLKKNANDIIDEITTQWTKKESYEFKETNINDGKLYFIFEKRIIIFKNTLSSYSLNPIGIIHKNKNNYTYLSFEEENKDLNKIINSFCKYLHLR